MTRTILLATAVVLFLPSLAPSQPAAGGYDLDRDIADYADTLSKIRDRRWIYLPVPEAGVLISPEQEANMFSYLILTGQMHPDSVAQRHRRYRAGTRILEQHVAAILEDLYAQRRTRELGPPQTPAATVLPDQAQGTVGGTWAVACRRGSSPLQEGGSFTLRLLGTGNVTGTYTGPSGSFPVTGTIDDAGNIRGGGSHPDGPFSFFARVLIVARTTPRLTGGTVRFTPNDPEVICSVGDLTPVVS